MKTNTGKNLIQRRESFLNELSKKLGRERKKEVTRPAWKVNPQLDVLKDVSQDELTIVLEEQCDAIHTKFVKTTKANLPNTILETIKWYESSSVITWKDDRFASFDLDSSLADWASRDIIEYHVWNSENREESVAIAERADVGLTFSDITLAESATVVLFSDKGKGRSVSLLPKTHIVIIPKSTIVPRMTQATKLIHEKVANDETIASCINFISGPSNSADIEMNLVVGVHGPLHAAYIVVDDA
ncbi:LutC/YkgG family protein [Pseudogracilibacillus sp. SO10305]|uniref:LutC/YkgG family protein n=1 Tax=Pseudogracilibacillus sp. SO10305 TaxID=3098292 RepID=UPI00300DF7E0